MLTKNIRPFTVIVDNEPVKLTVDMAQDDQMDIALLVLQNLKQWTACATTTDQQIAESYRPLRLTVRGAAGSGKSFFIKALANTIRDIYGDQNVVHISAPTGAAAHNVGGETIHRKFAINPHKTDKEMSKKEKMRLLRSKRRALVEIIDERSMLTCNVVGAAEKHAAETTHGGSHDNEDWGGIPVVIFVGDDYQLPPPTNKEKGAFDLLDSRTSFSQRSFGSGSFGCRVMWDMSETCVELRTTKRQNKNQTVFKRMLENLRIGEPTHADATELMKLHLSNLSPADQQEGEKCSFTPTRTRNREIPEQISEKLTF